IHWLCWPAVTTSIGPSIGYFETSAAALSFSIWATESCPRPRSATSNECSSACARPAHDGGARSRGRRLSLDQGAARDRGHGLDGRDALSAASVRLSRLGRAGVERIRDIQAHGEAPSARDHQSRDDRCLAPGPLARLAKWLLPGALAARQNCTR